MPRADELQESGKVLKWLKKLGDQVKEGEPIVEVMSEKVTFELTATASGVLHSIFVNEEIDVPVGKAIALISQPGDDPMALDKSAREVEKELEGLGVGVTKRR
jgi:pyruvate/2-oxoglutarate dehydrogenase complex dihydrolipoamide acyltransferase (E2) component